MTELKTKAYKLAIFAAVTGTLIEVINEWLPTYTTTVDGNVEWGVYFTFRYIIANLPFTFLTILIGSFSVLLVSLVYKKLNN